MTLTDLLPTLRRSLPDPIRLSAWPEFTSVTTTDVVIAGVSLLRLAELCETPCVHTADALVPGSRLRASLRRDAAVVVVTVTDVFDSPSGRVALIDGSTASVLAVWEETRLIGRTSTAAARPTVLLTGTSVLTDDGRGEASLPVDLAAGDLLAIPCTAIVALHDVRHRPALPTAPAPTLV